MVNEAEVETALAQVDPVWECLSPKEQSRILELLIERIEFDGASGQVSIVFRSTGFHGLIQRLAEEDAMKPKLAFTRKFQVELSQRGRKHLRESEAKRDVGHRVPRVAKLMALAIRFEGLVRDGVVADYAELARLGKVTRARVTQISNLLNLAPDIIEAILFLPAVERGKDPITERDLRPIVAVADWKKQRRMWRHLEERLETG